MRTLKIVTSTIAAGLLLASCSTRTPGGPQVSIAPPTTLEPAKVEPANPRNVGINGRWYPTDADARKVYYNEFRNGKFVSRSPDGAQTIAAGSYKTNANGDIQMDWYSEARKANASATCTQLSVNEMQCTSSGSVFNLRRA